MFKPELVSFLKLLDRSKELAGGWIEYSQATRPLVISMDKKFPGLFEVDDNENKVRRTAECLILKKWMNYAPN